MAVSPETDSSSPRGRDLIAPARVDFFVFAILCFPCSTTTRK